MEYFTLRTFWTVTSRSNRTSASFAYLPHYLKTSWKRGYGVDWSCSNIKKKS